MNGQIEVICGSMFSGKSSELIRRLERAVIAKKKVKSFKSVLDDRYDKIALYTHKGEKFTDTIPIKRASDIFENLESDIDVVGVDEAQFFDNSLVSVCEELAGKGIRVIVAGLDMDSNCFPFGPMPQLLCRAEVVTKLNAVCTKCGRMAGFTYRLSQSTEQILVGATDVYEARCRSCYAAGEAQKAVQQEQED